MLLLLHLVVETNEHSVAPVYCMPAACLVLLMLGKMERLGKQSCLQAVPSVVSHGDCWKSAVHFFLMAKLGYVSYLLLSFWMWSHSVGFWLALYVLVSISSLSWIQCLVSLLYFAHLFFAIIIIIMLSWYKMCFIIIFLSRSATLASASWQINCFYHHNLRFVMHLHFTALSRD